MWIMLAKPMVLASSLAILAPVSNERPDYHDTTEGFSMKPPAFDRLDVGESAQVAVFGGPAVDGLSPNCNVQIQGTELDLDAYERLTLNQFKSAGWIVGASRRSTVSGKPAISWQFSGEFGGKSFEWLSIAVAAPHRVYLLTCTASKEHFPNVKSAFKATIESFRVD